MNVRTLHLVAAFNPYHAHIVRRFPFSILFPAGFMCTNRPYCRLIVSWILLAVACQIDLGRELAPPRLFQRE